MHVNLTCKIARQLCVIYTSHFEKDGCSHVFDTIIFRCIRRIAGADAFARLNMLLFIALIISALVALFSLVFGHSHEVDTLPANGTSSCHYKDPAQFPMHETDINFYAPNAHTFHENLFSDFTEKNNQVRTIVRSITYISSNLKMHYFPHQQFDFNVRFVLSVGISTGIFRCRVYSITLSKQYRSRIGFAHPIFVRVADCGALARCPELSV